MKLKKLQKTISMDLVTLPIQGTQIFWVVFCVGKERKKNRWEEISNESSC